MPSAVDWITNSDELDPVQVKRKERHFFKLKSGCGFSVTKHMSAELSYCMRSWGRVTGDWFGKGGLVLGCQKTIEEYERLKVTGIKSKPAISNRQDKIRST